ncbi:hypothetical protein MHBO_003410 [Bonamia ostreae]|uniref:Ubiquitin-like protease family profile domain-containing protein n=2 Tax=Bonamia ostreae TaxID=126728 RepID=A0ABV2AQD4_9EUKA
MVNLSNSFFYNILNYFSNPCRDDQYVETNENISTPQKEIPHLMNSINDLEERIGRLKIEDDYLQQQIVDLNERTKSFLKPSPAFKFRKRVPKLKTSPKLTKLQKKLLNFKKRKITKNEKNILKRLENGLENATASEFDNFLVTFNDMQCLNPGKWLNDEIINFYMGLLQKRSDERMVVRKERDFFFNTFFYTTLTGNNMSSYHYNNVRRWTKRKKVKNNF